MKTSKLYLALLLFAAPLSAGEFPVKRNEGTTFNKLQTIHLDDGSEVHQIRLDERRNGNKLVLFQNFDFLEEHRSFEFTGQLRLKGKNLEGIEGRLILVTGIGEEASHDTFLSQTVDDKGDGARISAADTEWRNFSLQTDFSDHENPPLFVSFLSTVYRPESDGTEDPTLEFRNLRFIVPAEEKTFTFDKNGAILLDRGGSDRIRISPDAFEWTALYANDSGISIHGKDPDQKKYRILEFDPPNVPTETYQIEGEVRVIDWKPGLSGYVEMWSHLPAKAGGKEIATAFFSRTMAPAGPMKMLEWEDTEWRKFALPATINDGSKRSPLQLDLNVVLTGNWSKDEAKTPRVQLRNLRFVPDASAIPGTTSPAIVINRELGWPEFIVGTLFGIGLMILWKIFKRRKTETELRRMRAVDSAGNTSK